MRKKSEYELVLGKLDKVDVNTRSSWRCVAPPHTTEFQTLKFHRCLHLLACFHYCPLSLTEAVSIYRHSIQWREPVNHPNSSPTILLYIYSLREPLFFIHHIELVLQVPKLRKHLRDLFQCHLRTPRFWKVVFVEVLASGYPWIQPPWMGLWEFCWFHVLWFLCWSHLLLRHVGATPSPTITSIPLALTSPNWVLISTGLVTQMELWKLHTGSLTFRRQIGLLGPSTWIVQVWWGHSLLWHMWTPVPPMHTPLRCLVIALRWRLVLWAFQYQRSKQRTATVRWSYMPLWSSPPALQPWTRSGKKVLWVEALLVHIPPLANMFSLWALWIFFQDKLAQEGQPHLQEWGGEM